MILIPILCIVGVSLFLGGVFGYFFVFIGDNTFELIEKIVFWIFTVIQILLYGLLLLFTMTLDGRYHMYQPLPSYTPIFLALFILLVMPSGFAYRRLTHTKNKIYRQLMWFLSTVMPIVAFFLLIYCQAFL